MRRAVCVPRQVFGDKDSDGFYHGESGGLSGYVPSNMVAEVPVDDEYLKQVLMQQGFLPVDHAGTNSSFSARMSDCDLQTENREKMNLNQQKHILHLSIFNIIDWKNLIRAKPSSSSSETMCKVSLEQFSLCRKW